MRPIADILEEHTPRLMALPGVVGTAQGLEGGVPCICVLAARRSRELERRLPATLEGHPVVLRVTGEIRALDADPGRGSGPSPGPGGPDEDVPPRVG